MKVGDLVVIKWRERPRAKGFPTYGVVQQLGPSHDGSDRAEVLHGDRLSWFLTNDLEVIQ